MSNPEHLELEVCRECKCEIMVAKYSPHPLEREATGMSASRWDGDQERDYFVGWICNECAFKSALSSDGGAVCGGGDSMEFRY